MYAIEAVTNFIYIKLPVMSFNGVIFTP